MKYLTSTFLILMIGGLSLQAQVQSTPATIYLQQGGNPQGFIQGSRPGGILFSPTEGVRGKEYSLSQISGTGIEKGVRLEARSEVLAEPRADFANDDYIEAAKGFAKVVGDYQQLILNIPQNFASEAMFYQIESLRRAGNFKILQSLLDSPAGKSMDSMLSDRYKNQIRFQKLWAVYGSGDMAALEKALEAYQEPVVGKASLLPAPNFRKMPQRELVQIAFMRGKLYESKGEKEKALQDYMRAFTMTFAYEPFLSKQAMGAALVIQSADPALKSENEKVKKAPLREIQSVAYFFSKRFPETSMPPQFQEYAKMPEYDVVLKVQEEAPPAAEEKPAPAAKEDTPKKDAPKADGKKPKGKAKKGGK
ncbi:MAG: hypothetical protein P1V20_28120 [Verrucomicrobiales bacterium]|nr:hypothetical protein [Verrucomicrobiales bacterium]